VGIGGEKRLNNRVLFNNNDTIPNKDDFSQFFPFGSTFQKHRVSTDEVSDRVFRHKFGVGLDYIHRKGTPGNMGVLSRGVPP
jgi:hypothetical protein